MTTARLFKNGRSQAVRIPKEMEFDADEVEIVSVGKGLYVIPKEDGAWAHVKAVAEESSSYPEALPEAPDQKRDLTW
jgi:antitoxin VapB